MFYYYNKHREKKEVQERRQLSYLRQSTILKEMFSLQRICTDSNNSVKPNTTQGNDELIGTSQRDTITDLGGNDRFNGCSSDDILNGNSGNDGIAGGPDNGNLHGNEGNDYLQGDSGSDSLYGNEGNDILVGNEDRQILLWKWKRKDTRL
jgi:hypothetical protein